MLAADRVAAVGRIKELAVIDLADRPPDQPPENFTFL
jgi:hypothetical protein